MRSALDARKSSAIIRSTRERTRLVQLDKRPPPQEDIQFQVLRRLQATPDISQRALAKELGISLGSINYCFQALMQKGWVKVQNFQQSNHKLGYMYLLTPSGIAQKSVLTGEFLKWKLQEYEALSREIEMLKAESHESRGDSAS